MKKTILIWTVSLFFTILSAYSQNSIVNEDLAKKAASMFYFERIQAYEKVSIEDISLVLVQKKYDNNLLLYYVFNIEGGGFVIVSGSTKTKAVLGYSFKNNFDSDNIAPNFNAWMQHYEAQISFVEKNNILPDKSILDEWEHLSSSNVSQAKDFTKEKSVLPLISSRWNQGNYYNGMCPGDPAGPGGKAYAGCVATAMGQLMYYHRWPVIGTGSYNYLHPVYGNISADFGSTTYDWNAMPNSINKPNKGIAELLFHLGVSVDMNYGPNGSGMWNHSAARSLRNYFKYCPETEYIFRDSTTLAWDSILIANLDNKKPLYYAGWTENPSDSSGHAFVCDGYQGFDYFHFDWGWGGAFNGYFYLHQLTPGGANFNFRQEVIKDIYPDTINYAYPVFCSGHTLLTDIVGSIEDGSGANNYQNNTSCSWLIAPELQVNNITLSFDYFETEDINDIVKVYDGDNETATLLGEFSGSTLPQQVTSSGNRMLITFSSNDSVNYKGFRATYNSSIPTYCSPLLTINSESDTISDGSGQYNYNYLTNCRWRINPTNKQSITIEFLSFDVDENNDILEIYDYSTNPVSLVDTYTGNTIPTTKTYNSNYLMLWFKTRTFNPKSGWELVFTSSETTVEEIPQVVDISIYPNPTNNNVNIAAKNTSISLIEIFSIDGKKMHHFNNSKSHFNAHTVSTNDWSKGLYIIKIESENSTTHSKLLVY